MMSMLPGDAGDRVQEVAASLHQSIYANPGRTSSGFVQHRKVAVQPVTKAVVEVVKAGLLVW